MTLGQVESHYGKGTHICIRRPSWRNLFYIYIQDLGDYYYLSLMVGGKLKVTGKVDGPKYQTDLVATILLPSVPASVSIEKISMAVNTYIELVGVQCKILNKKGSIMRKDRDMTELVGNVVHVAKVEVEGFKPFMVNIDKHTPVNEGDMVVVDLYNNQSYAIGKLVAMYDVKMTDNAELILDAKAWVVCLVTQGRHLARIDATNRREVIIKQLDAKQKQLDVIKMYEALATTDTEARDLVAELKSLDDISYTHSAVPPRHPDDTIHLDVADIPEAF